jgi:hypothetical protein
MQASTMKAFSVVDAVPMVDGRITCISYSGGRRCLRCDARLRLHCAAALPLRSAASERLRVRLRADPYLYVGTATGQIIRYKPSSDDDVVRCSRVAASRERF